MERIEGTVDALEKVWNAFEREILAQSNVDAALMASITPETKEKAARAAVSVILKQEERMLEAAKKLADHLNDEDLIDLIEHAMGIFNGRAEIGGILLGLEKSDFTLEVYDRINC